MMKHKTYLLIALLTAIVILVLLGSYPPSLDKDKSRKQYTVHQCTDYRSGCKASINNKEIEIKFPTGIVFLERFPIEVKLPGIRADKVMVEFVMVGMDMGLNFYQLKQPNDKIPLWKGTGVLPVCTTGRTDWQSIVSIKTGNEVLKIAFQFEVSSQPQ